MSKAKLIIYGVIGLVAVYFIFFSKDESAEGEWVEEEIATPTQGLVTTVKEVESDLFKIEDEATVATPADSRIVAKYMNGNIDTFTLDEARLVDADSSSGSRRNPIISAATMGLFGFMMGRSMGVGPSAGAYMDQNTYNRVTSNAGQSINSTAQRTTVRRPAGKSGFGGGRSTRSVGG
jgi:hypothetical protein